jgi:hypothetical protein
LANPQPDYHAGRKKNGRQENYQGQKDRAGKTNREGGHEGNKKSARQKKTRSKASEEGSKESDKGHQEADKKNNEEASQEDSEKSREENCEANCKEGAQAIAGSFCENPLPGDRPAQLIGTMRPVAITLWCSPSVV